MRMRECDAAFLPCGENHPLAADSHDAAGEMDALAALCASDPCIPPRDTPCPPCSPAAAIAVIGRCRPPLSSITKPRGSAVPPAKRSRDSGGGFCREGGRSTGTSPQGLRACTTDAEVARRCLTGTSCAGRGCGGVWRGGVGWGGVRG